MSADWKDTKWMRLVGPDGSRKDESSDEQGLLSQMKPGDTLQRWQEKTENRWVDVATLQAAPAPEAAA
jgi:hypothetical protein